MIWHDLSHHVVVLAAASTNGARVLKTRRAGKIGLSGGCGAEKCRARRKFLSEKKGMDGADRFFNYGRDNAAAAATTLTIRHSRFAALTLAKLVASLALHPPVSATEADYAPHHRLRRSLSSRRSLLVGACSNYLTQPRLFFASNHAPVAR